MSIPEVYYNDDKESFAFTTCRERWPKILEDAIADVNKTAAQKPELEQSSKRIVAKLNEIHTDLINGETLKEFSHKETELIAGLSSYNEALQKHASEKRYANNPMTWKNAPWLFNECYLYRKIDAAVKGESDWEAWYDIFHNLKQKSFKGTEQAVIELCKRFNELDSSSDKSLLFKEFIDVCLWGNKVDLSLLVNKSSSEVHSGQNKEARIKAEANILANDTSKVWEYLQSLQKDVRIDFVLDNSGFETFTDLVFALFLLDFKIASQIRIHCKTRPWMVSDSLIKDIKVLLDDLKEDSFFCQTKEIQLVHDKIASYLKEGKITLTDSEFWTIDKDYWNLVPGSGAFGADELYSDLKDSDLIFIKGDLNYRKLTGDRKWDKTETFSKAIGPLATSGLKIVTLRTCKADVCVGLQKGVDEILCKKWHAETGELGNFWCNSGNWGVICFSKGE